MLICGLVTQFQFMERLPDRRAAAALHSRLDWKYALHLPLNHPGLASSLLCEFRHQLWDDPLRRQEFQLMIDTMTERSWLSFEDRLQSTADALISSVCNLSRIELLADSLCVALETLAASQPDWLLKTALPYWFDRYTKRKLLSDLPNNLPDQFALAQAIGLDAAHLLGAVEHEAGLAHLREIRLLQRVYSEQFDLSEKEAHWRQPQCVSCGLAV
jgi:transposase